MDFQRFTRVIIRTAVVITTVLCPFLVRAQKTSTTTMGQALSRELLNRDFRNLTGAQNGKLPYDEERFKDIKDRFSKYEHDTKKEITIQFLMQKKEGGVGSGGGTGYRAGLLDLALYNQSAFYESTAGSKLPLTKAFKRVGFDRLNNVQFPIVQKALAQLRKWYPSSPEISPRVASALQAMPLYYAVGEIKGNAIGYFLPKNSEIQAEELSILGIYFPKLGNFTSKTRFEAMSEANQVAYLIHEALRHMQISHESLMSNETLQKLTAQIMKDPQPTTDTLDTPEFMMGPILSTVVSKQQLMLLTIEVSAKACDRYEILCDVMDQPANLRALALKTSAALDKIAASRRADSSNPQITHAELTQDIVNELEVRNLISWYHLHHISTAITGTDEAAFNIGRAFNFGVLDHALENLNQKIIYDTESMNLHMEVQEVLVKGGLMNSSEAQNFPLTW